MIRFLGKVSAQLFAGWSGRLRGESLVVLLSSGANALAGVVFVLFTARHLGPAGRGDIVVAFTLAWATTSIADLGTSTSGRIGLLRPYNRVAKIDVMSLNLGLLPLQVVVAGAATAAISATSMALTPQFSTAVVVLSIVIMFYNSTCSLLKGLRKYRDVLILDLWSTSIQVVSLGCLLAVGRLTAVSAVLAMAAGHAIGTSVSIYRADDLHVQNPLRHTGRWKDLIVDGLSPMAGSVAMFVALRLNRLVIAVAVGSRSLGLFTIALTIPETLRAIPRAVGQVIADRGRSGVDSDVTARRHCRLFVAAHSVVLFVGAALGWILIPVVFGEDFRDARNLLAVITVAEVVLSVHLMHQALLVAFGRPSGIGAPQVVGAVVTVVLNLTMIPRWGMTGAAWACLLGYSALALSSSIWTSREMRRIRP